MARIYICTSVYTYVCRFNLYYLLHERVIHIYFKNLKAKVGFARVFVESSTVVYYSI